MFSKAVLICNYTFPEQVVNVFRCAVRQQIVREGSLAFQKRKYIQIMWFWVKLYTASVPGQHIFASRAQGHQVTNAPLDLVRKVGIFAILSGFMSCTGVLIPACYPLLDPVLQHGLQVFFSLRLKPGVFTFRLLHQ